VYYTTTLENQRTDKSDAGDIMCRTLTFRQHDGIMLSKLMEDNIISL